MLRLGQKSGKPRKRKNSGSLGSKRQTDRFPPNKKALILAYRAFKEFPVPIVPGYFNHFTLFSLWTIARMFMAMAEGKGEGSELTYGTSKGIHM